MTDGSDTVPDHKVAVVGTVCLEGTGVSSFAAEKESSYHWTSLVT